MFGGADTAASVRYIASAMDGRLTSENLAPQQQKANDLRRRPESGRTGAGRFICTNEHRRPTEQLIVRCGLAGRPNRPHTISDQWGGFIGIRWGKIAETNILDRLRFCRRKMGDMHLIMWEEEGEGKRS